MATGEVSLKLLVDTRSQTVVFAEAGKDFVDFLFHILALPVGTVIRLLAKIGMVGSLGNLYGSVEQLDSSAICPHCNGHVNHICTLVESPASNPMAAAVSAAESDGKGGFVQGVVTYMVADDLEVKPMSTISSITLLNQFNVMEIGHLEERVVSLGLDEGIKLLRASLHSKKVLNAVFLGEKRERS